MTSAVFEMITASDVRAKSYSLFTQQELDEIIFANLYKVVGRLCLYCGSSSIRYWNDSCGDHCYQHSRECHHTIPYEKLGKRKR